MYDGCVSLKQFHEWLQKNKHRTWYLGEGGGFQREGTPMIKYFYPKFDSRCMKIFRIDTHPARFGVDFRDVKDGQNILDLLDQRIEEKIQQIYDDFNKKKSNK